MLSINLGWGVGVTMAIMTAGPVSGAHLNPAVSVALAAVGKFSPKKLVHYILAQYLGAFLGAATVYLIYLDALHHYTGGHIAVAGPNATAGIFATYPAPGVSNLGGAIDQVFGTCLLLLLVCAVGTPSNSGVSRSLAPLLVGLAVVNIGICFGHNCGYAINPARDLGPRLFTAVAGWGAEVFTAHNYWFWIPVVCCHIGGILGAALFTLLIENNTPEQKLES